MQQPEDDRVEVVVPDEEVIDYVEGVGDEKPRMPGGWRALAMPFVVAIIVCFGMLMFWAMPQMVSKDDFTANIQSLVTDIGALETADNEFTATLRNMITESKVNELINSKLNNYVTSSQLSSSLSDYAKLTNLGSYTTESRVNELINSKLNGYAKSSTLTSREEFLQLQINALKDTIEELEKQIEDGGTVSGLAISTFTPQSGVSGTQVTISGTGFTNVTNVTFGGVSALSVTVNSPTHITATVGSGATGMVAVYTSSGSTVSTSTFTYGSTGGGTSTSSVTAFVVGGTTLTLNSPTVNTINVSIYNGGSKIIYAEQLSLSLQFLSPPSNISTWGLTLTGESTTTTIGSPSYSIVPGVVLYIVGAGEYIQPGESKTISIILTAPLLVTTHPVNFVTAVYVTSSTPLP